MKYTVLPYAERDLGKESRASSVIVACLCFKGVGGIVECRIIVQNGLADFNYFLL